jgi:hypothetical protein
MDQIAVLLAPGQVPDELGGSYEDACAALELPPVPGGYTLYLLDQMNQRQTLISTDTTAMRQAELGSGSGGDGYLDKARVATADIAEVRTGWPEEFGGGPRCQFCRAPDPAWVYEGADVEVLLGEPVLGFRGEPRPVIRSDVVGCIDWHACSACHDQIEVADLAAWRGLLDRYGDPRCADARAVCLARVLVQPQAARGRRATGVDTRPPPSHGLRDRRPMGRLHRRPPHR